MTELSQLVDELGALKARISALTRQEEVIKDAIKASGLREIDGELYRATVSTSDRATVDWKSIAAHFSPSSQMVVGNTSHSTVTVLRVVACTRAS